MLTQSMSLRNLYHPSLSGPKEMVDEAHFKHEIFKQVCTIQGIQDEYSQLHSSFSKT